MSTNLNTVTIRLRRDTSNNWTEKNPILKLGEPGLETDTRKLKFGDGVTNWQNLPYAGISSSSDTGDVSFSGIKIIGNGEGSGDGNGYSTIELVPDADLYENNQYLIVDPTAPNHIHLRAGGTQDASNAELIIGGEKNNIRINDQSPLARMQTESLIILNTYYLTSPEFSSVTWDTVDGNNRIVINNPTQTVYDAVWALSGNSDSLLNVIDDSGNYYELTSNGSSTPGGDAPVMVYVNQAPPSNPTVITELTFEIRQNRQTFLEASGNDVRIEAADDIRIYSRDAFRLYNYSANDPIEIFTDYNDAENRWAFRADGILELSTGGVQFSDETIQNTAINSKEDIGLGNVDNTSDLDKPISSAVQTALNNKADIDHNHDAIYRKIEYITLSPSSIPAPITAVKDREYIIRDNSGFVGPIAVSNFVINDPVGGSVGDGYVVYKPSYTFHNVVIGGVTYSNTSSFYIYRYLYINNLTPTWKTVFFNPVQSVAGKTGVVTLTKNDVGLNNVDNTSDANKPVSTAQQTALDLKINSTEVDTDLVGGPGISLSYNSSDDSLSISSNNENYIAALGGRSGSTPINYDPATSSIQTLTLGGKATTFTKGTGWPTASNISVDTILRITVTSATSITWSIVNDWFAQPPAGALSVGTHLFLLRAIGSGIIEGHYIGNKTN